MTPKQLTRLVGAITASVGAIPLQGAVSLTGVNKVTFSVPTSSASELSGISYISGNSYYAVSDNATVLYPLTLGLNTSTAVLTSMSIGTAFQLRDAAGVALSSRDLEGVAYNSANNSVYVSDELGPTIREHSLTTGNTLLSITPSTSAQLNVFSNIRSNMGWESIGRQSGGATAWTANQDALTVDGNTSTLAQGGLVRVQKFDSAMAAAGQWAYRLDAGEANWTSLTNNSISDILVLPDGTPIALERAIGVPNVGSDQMRIRLYKFETTGATNLNGGSSSGATTVIKTLMFQNFFDTNNTQFEGITLGPRLDNGDYTIVMLADNGNTAGSTTHALYTLRATGIDPTSTWNVNNNGNWSAPGSWDAGGVPSGNTAIANFGSIINAAHTVTVDTPRTVSIINLNNASAYTIAGTAANVLTLDAATGSPNITVSAGSHAISATTSVAKSLTVAVTPSNSVLTWSGAITFTPGVTLTKQGAGSLDVKNIRDAAVNLADGKIRVITDGSNAATSKLTSLTIDLSANGQFNVRNNKLIVAGGANPIATRDLIRSYCSSGRNAPPGSVGDGTWNGPGITSSTASNTNATDGIESRVVAYALNSELPLGQYATFGGLPVSGTDILVRYTKNGDADLDGKCGDSDVTVVGAFYDHGVSTTFQWCNGDFNFDGRVDDGDVTLLGAFYNEAAAPVSPARLAAQYGEEFAEAFAAGLAMNVAVPEPTALAVISLAAMMLARRRRATS